MLLVLFLQRLPLRKFLYILFLLIGWLPIYKAQKVGLVLSGGGSSGLCHIGMLKALEENNIPVDYVCGTSIGGLIGAYYASGHSPAEMERLVKTYFFQNVTRGDVPVKYEYMVKKREDYAAWLNFKYDFRDNYLKNLPTNVVNSMPIDYYLMENFSGVSNRFKNNFDSLLIPFRCVASDIADKKSVVFSQGDLASAIRASMSYPFYLRPLQLNGKLLFDGGLYNNFPADIMLKEFHPDVLIGCNVAEKNATPDDENVYLQLRTLLMSETDFNPHTPNGFVVEPWCDVSVFDFNKAQRLIDSGYASTMRLMPEIKKKITRLADGKALEEKRTRYKSYLNLQKTVIEKIEVEGFSPAQVRFITRSLYYGKKPFTLQLLRKRYFRLASEDKIKNIYPVLTLNPLTGNYTLKLKGKKEKPFYLEPGSIISNRPISEGFLGLQFNHLGKVATSAYVNGYAGKLYTGSYSQLRFDFPGRVPFFVQPSFTWSRWDYYSSSALFYDFIKPAYLVQEDQFGEIKVGVPVGNISQFNISAGVTQWKNQYYQTDIFTKADTADVTYFNYSYLQANYKINTLNRKMYASEGSFLNLRARYLIGRESHFPGNTSIDTTSFRNLAKTPWLQFKLTFDNYIRPTRYFKFGILFETVYSTQSFFSNYQASILSAPAFNPTPESQTFFIDAYRAHNYLAGGFKLISSPSRNFDLRAEAYVFQPVLSIRKNVDGKAEYTSKAFLYRYLSGMVALVYNSPIGPVSASVNYYDKSDNPVSFFLHIGYIIFNRKSID